MINIDRIETAKDIAKKLNDEGFSCYFVGGFIRDFLLGQEDFNDIDLATNALPEQVKDVFSKHSEFSVIDIGIEHGTVGVVYNEQLTDVTTFRKDISCDGRNATIEFAETIEEDLSRRDFTCNSITYDPFEGKYIDPYYGRDDIENKIIKAVGDPVERFTEDLLRLVRAARFSAQLGFSIDSNTYLGAKQVTSKLSKKEFLDKISMERIKAEIDKCFIKAEKPSIMFNLLYDWKILGYILPELSRCYGVEQNIHHKFNIFDHTLLAVDNVPKEFPLIRWSALLHDIGKVDVRKKDEALKISFLKHEVYSEKHTEVIAKRLKFSNYEKKKIVNLVSHHMQNFTPEMKDSSIRKFVASIGVENIEDFCILRYADKLAKDGTSPKPMGYKKLNMTERIDKILKEDNTFKVSDLKINGYDIMDLLKMKNGGAEVGKILNYLLETVLENPELNEEMTLKRLVLENEKNT
jgi:poly(A) polymerase/tRNA nucleotidyltransferase (CCA-adding enzyme)